MVMADTCILFSDVEPLEQSGNTPLTECSGFEINSSK